MGKKKAKPKPSQPTHFNEYDDDSGEDDYDVDSDAENLIPKTYEEDYTNETAAQISRLPFTALSELEDQYFYNVDPEIYLKIRNSILRIWLKKPSVGLTFEYVKTKLKIEDRSYSKLMGRVLRFLERYGYINYGIFENNMPLRCVNPDNRRRRIIIIGAGAAGLAAARQLIYFGFDVIVLEASRRVGGRCYSFYKNETFFDAGNVLVSGIKENPIKVVMRQLGLNAKRLRPKHKLYMDGNLVDKKKESVMQKIFLVFLRTLYYITIEKGITEIHGKQMTPEVIFDMFLYSLELSATTRALDYWQDLSTIEQNLNHFLDIFVQDFNIYMLNSHFLNKVMQSHIEPSDQSKRKKKEKNVSKEEMLKKQCFDRSFVLDEQFLKRGNVPEFDSLLASHLAIFESVLDNYSCNEIIKHKELIMKTDKFNEKACSEFLSTEDRRILEWYFGTLEQCLGAPLANYSLKMFAQDDFDHLGQQYVLPDGYMNFMQAMYSRGCNMKIFKKMQAHKIKLRDDCVEVLAIKSSTEKISFRADAVICTVPLGVLKKAISDDDKFENKIHFEPPLPEHKKSAIERFGFGTVNKVTLGFDTKFWGSKDQFLGNVALSRESRGEFLMSYFYDPSLWNIGKHEVKSKKKKKMKHSYSISSIISGKCVEKMNITDDVIIASKCYNGLKEIFENIPSNIQLSITHWEKEPFYMGTHSYPTPKCTEDDYDIMAEPVGLPNVGPRLFFAGEHTHAEFPSTVHGAFISGLRAASQVADLFDPLDF